MDDDGEAWEFEWAEEQRGQKVQSLAGTRRKRRTKRKEFVGWASRPLVEFLEFVGRDTSEKISQHDVVSIINEYTVTNNLLHPLKKKKIVCDKRLHSIFGRKTISRIRIYDMLEKHFAENQEESDDSFFYSSDEKEKCVEVFVPDTQKSSFAAVIPGNIKLVYLKRTLVEDLLKDSETFEAKVLGSFVRIKSDPNDYLQKNSHQLVEVTGVKKILTTDNRITEVLIQAPYVVKDIRICTLSDDDFSEEECEDLHQRVKDGLIKRPTVVELQQKAQMLHVDITKHSLAREIRLLQNLIDQANEKGWRRQLDQYLERKILLQKPEEQSRLLCDTPKVTADEMECEEKTKEIPESSKRQKTGSPTSAPQRTSETPGVLASKGSSSWTPDFVVEDRRNVSSKSQTAQPESLHNTDRQSPLANDASKSFQEMESGKVEVIDLTDGEDDEVRELSPVDNPESLIWNYKDPQGDIQGPFPLTSLKRWSDAYYFPSDFKVWKTGLREMPVFVTEEHLGKEEGPLHLAMINAICASFHELVGAFEAHSAAGFCHLEIKRTADYAWIPES